MIDVLLAASSFQDFALGVGALLGVAVGVTLSAAAALIGLGWGYSSAKRHVTGGAFGYRIGTEDEYPKKWRDAYIDSVKNYIRSNP